MIELLARFFTLDGFIASEDAMIYISFSPEDEIVEGFIKWCKSVNVEPPEENEILKCFRTHFYDIVVLIREREEKNENSN